MADQCKKHNIFGNLVKEKCIEALQSISFDIFIKQIDFDDFYKDYEVVGSMIVISVVKS